MLPLIEAAHGLKDMAREMALVIAPQELREVYDGSAITDLDIIAVRSGRFIIGEVKSDARAFDSKCLEVLATVALEIRPDVLMLAATGTEWPVEVAARIADLKETLGGKRIEVVTRLLEW